MLKDLIEAYWRKEDGALQQRWREFLGVTVPFLTKLVAMLVRGGSEELQRNEVELARERVQSIDVNLVDLSVQDGIDELRRQRDLLNELAQLGLRRAPVAKLHRERYALLLQRTPRPLQASRGRAQKWRSKRELRSPAARVKGLLNRIQPYSRI